MSGKLRRYFSKRRQQIEQELGKRGLETAAAARFANFATRPAKETQCSLDEKLAMWNHDITQMGFTPWDDAVGRRKQVVTTARKLEASFDEAVENITAKQSHFSSEVLLRECLLCGAERGLLP